MDAENIDIDLTKFDFPSDRLAVKDLRRLFPGRIDDRDPDEPGKDGSVFDRLADLLLGERAVAINTYDDSRKRYHDFGLYGEDLRIVRDELAKDYIKYGVAQGPEHADQLVRSIEAQARREAELHTGKGRR